MFTQNYKDRIALLSILFKDHIVNYQFSRARDQISLKLVDFSLLVRAIANKDRIYNCRLCIQLNLVTRFSSKVTIIVNVVIIVIITIIIIIIIIVFKVIKTFVEVLLFHIFYYFNCSFVTLYLSSHIITRVVFIHFNDDFL